MQELASDDWRRGKGLRIKPEPKSKSGYRTLELPRWAIRMLQRRGADIQDAAVFSAPLGGLRDPNNTSHQLRQAFDAAGDRPGRPPTRSGTRGCR
jgi:hypothetical protein